LAQPRTRLAGGGDDGGPGEGLLAARPPELVSLAGGCRHVGLFIAETEGYIHPGADVMPETVAEHWGQITDVSDFCVPADTDSWLAMNADWIAANSTVLSA
jgi:hypothetical protein